MRSEAESLKEKIQAANAGSGAATSTADTSRWAYKWIEATVVDSDAEPAKALGVTNWDYKQEKENIRTDLVLSLLDLNSHVSL